MNLYEQTVNSVSQNSPMGPLAGWKDGWIKFLFARNPLDSNFREFYAVPRDIFICFITSKYLDIDYMLNYSMSAVMKFGRNIESLVKHYIKRQ